MENVWKIKPANRDAVAELAFELELPTPVATLYVQRGLDTEEKARAFEDLSSTRLHNPFLLPDIDAVLARLCRAIDNKEHIYVHGDYDVDGVTSTAVMTRCLQLLGADSETHVPHRMYDGYDVRKATVDKALEAKATLLMTVDCGVVAFEAATYAAEMGLDLIITDHHHPSDDGRIPVAVGVVNPNRHDSKYPFPGLAGVGIAFKVMVALTHLRNKSGLTDWTAKKMMAELIEYVALGTVADVAPMIDENRVLVRLGCKQLTQSAKPGIQQLLKVAGVKTVNTTAIGFFLGPRINAIGRMADSESALRLMLETSEARASVLATQLDTANKRRQEQQEQVVKEAQEMVPKDMTDCHMIVVGAKGWHKGLVGLAAGKLAEQFGRPALVCAIHDDGMARGSCRSTRSFNILDALKSEGCWELFSKRGDGSVICGGHAFAAGFELPADNLPLLRERLNAYAKRITDGGFEPVRIMDIDARVQPGDITASMFDKMNKLAPFGSENPEPIFLARNMRIIDAKTMGGDGKHLKLRLQGPKPNDPWVACTAWRMGHLSEEFKVDGVVDVVFKLSMDEFRGRSDLTMTVEDMRTSGPDKQAAA